MSTLIANLIVPFFPSKTLTLHSPQSSLLLHFNPRIALKISPLHSLSFPCFKARILATTTPSAASLGAQDVGFEAGNDGDFEDEEGSGGMSGGFDWGQQEENSDEEERSGPMIGSQSLKLFVGNLPSSVDSEKLGKIFGQAGDVEIAEVIYDRYTDQSRGFGFVTMCHPEASDKAIDMFNLYEIGGRRLVVNVASPRGSKPIQTRSTVVPSRRFYVGNLQWEIDSSQLRELFAEHGEVLDAQIVYDRESGRSRGFGFVNMSTDCKLEDIVAALDGKNLNGRPIRVEVATQRL